MASKRRKRRHECSRKRAFPTHRMATAVMYRHGINPDCCVYRCPHCGGWHIGHKRREDKRRLNQFGDGHQAKMVAHRH